MDSGAPVCALPEVCCRNVKFEASSDAGMQYTAANGEFITETGVKVPTLAFQDGDVESLRFRVTDKVHKPLVAASKIVAAGNRVVLQPESEGGSYIQSLSTKKRKKMYERNGVVVLRVLGCEAAGSKRTACTC